MYLCKCNKSYFIYIAIGIILTYCLGFFSEKGACKYSTNLNDYNNHIHKGISAASYLSYYVLLLS